MCMCRCRCRCVYYGRHALLVWARRVSKSSRSRGLPLHARLGRAQRGDLRRVAAVIREWRLPCKDWAALCVLGPILLMLGLDQGWCRCVLLWLMEIWMGCIAQRPHRRCLWHGVLLLLLLRLLLLRLLLHVWRGTMCWRCRARALHIAVSSRVLVLVARWVRLALDWARHLWRRLRREWIACIASGRRG